MVPIRFDERQERIRTRLRERGLSALVLTPGLDLAWASGLRIDTHERLTAWVLPATGDPRLVCPAFELERLGNARIGAAVPWSDGADPVRTLAETLAAAGATDGKIALGAETSLAVAAACRRGLPKDVWALDEDVVGALRAVKSPAELERLRRAAAITCEGLAAASAKLSAGMTERQASALVRERLVAAGADDAWAFVQFGDHSAIPHGESTDRPLARGTAVLIDLGAIVEGYHADVTRSGWWGGAPPDRYRLIHATVDAARRAGIAALRRGARGADADFAARTVVAKTGFGAAFVHRLGHGLGLAIHEPPYLAADSTAELPAGAVVTVEPGIYLPGEFGVRLEDDAIVTDGGAETITEAPIDAGGAWR